MKFPGPTLTVLKKSAPANGFHPGSIKTTRETNDQEFGSFASSPRREIASLAAARFATTSFADNFYRKVYPPAPQQQQFFDFADNEFLEDYVRESKNLLRTKGVMTEYIFIACAEMGMYHTLHRLKARVPTSNIVRKYLRRGLLRPERTHLVARTFMG